MTNTRYVRSLIATAGVVSLVAVGQHVSAQELIRGLKSKIPVKPHFEEPRFKEEQPDPLQQRQVLPDLPDQESSDTIAQSRPFKVNKIKIVGSTIFSKVELATIAASYEGRLVTIEELQGLRQLLSVKYFQLGYVNSGVVIPDQNIENGVVEFRVIEGRMNNIQLSGNDDIDSDYILDRIARGIDTPLNVNDLQKVLRRLQNDRLIKKINAQLKPLPDLGEAVLDVSVAEASSRIFSLVLDNYRAPSVGAEEVTISYSDFNLSGGGDVLGVSLSGSEGLTSGSLDYAYPLSVDGSEVGISFNYNDSSVIEDPFDQLDIESESYDYGIRYSHPIYRESGTVFDFTVGFNHKDSSSFLLGEPFSFSSGAIEGESRSSHINIGGSLVYRAAAQVYSLSLTLKQGIDVLDSNVADDNKTPDSEFSAIVGQGQYASRLDFWPGSQFITRSAFQLSFDPLLSIDKFSLGGHSTVRGYRENQLVRDNGVSASLEFRLPLFIDDAGRSFTNLQLVPFFDWGQAWDEDGLNQTDEKLDIMSIGLGFAWQPLNGIRLDAYWGEALENEVKSDEGDDLQDDGLHVSLAYDVAF
jgi:hemolysin activation/secretion protein